MPQPISSARRITAALAWLAGGALGWALVVGVLWSRELRTYQQVLWALPGWLALGALAGAATGLGQALAGRLLGQRGPARRWVWASVAGYGLALPAGLLMAVLLPLVLGTPAGLLLPWSEPGSLFYLPFPADPIYAGFVVGLCQWPALRPRLPRPTPAMRWLWIFGAWLAVGLGLFAGGAAATILLGTASGVSYALVWGAGWGLTIGLVNARILWVLRREPAPRNERPAEFREATGRSEP